MSSNDELNQDELKEIQEELSGRRKEGRLGKSVLNFFIGIILALLGTYLIMQNTTLYMNYSAITEMMGFNPPFGLVLLPLIIGIGILFFSSKSIFGWIITIFGVLSILLGILLSLKITFRPVSLYYGILMYGMTSAGIGMFLKAIFGGK